MGLFRCVNIQCGLPPKGFEFEGDKAECPKCGRANPPGLRGPHVRYLIPVHFMVLHPQGPILGEFGRQYVACTPKRGQLAAHAADEFAATDDVRAVTCPSCKGTTPFKEMAKLFPDYALNEEQENVLRELAEAALKFDPCSK